MAPNVKPPAAKRGRPSKSDLQARKDAAAQAEAIMNGSAKPSETTDPTPAPKPAKPAKAKENAPGFGHNAPDESVFLRHVHAIQQHIEGPLAVAKAKVKEENGKLKDLRQLAKADGLVLKELDEAVEDARTERVDLVAKEQRRRLYRQWLGLPMEQADLFEENEKTPSLAREQLRWKAQGNTDGRLGRNRVSPEGCPPNMDSHYLEGWDEGQAALMRASPLTAGAFNADGSVKGAPTDAATAAHDVMHGGDKPAETPAPTPVAVLILGPTDFTVEDLADANLKTLVSPDVTAKFEAAERVVAVFNGKRRILKEPGYVDDGVGELSDEEEAAPEELAAIAEAEPDLVETAIEDQADADSDAAFEAYTEAEALALVEGDDDAEIPGEKPLESDQEGGEFH